MFCGPATPDFPFESSGLGCSDFARHYFRNHGCFLLLQVLRWFTSLSSLPTTMYSSQDTWCSHQVGSPIRTFPDHKLLAPPRDFSQLATSFFAYLRQGILTHALSSLTIKLTLDTEFLFFQRVPLPDSPLGYSFCLLVCMPVRYSVVKDLEAGFLQPRIQRSLPSSA